MRFIEKSVFLIDFFDVLTTTKYFASQEILTNHYFILIVLLRIVETTLNVIDKLLKVCYYLANGESTMTQETRDVLYNKQAHELNK